MTRSFLANLGRPASPAVLAAAALLLLACAGCDDATDPCRPPVPAGRIQGYVRTGGLPIDAVVSATRIVEGSGTESVIETEPDAGGLYHLDVPAGRYVVSLRVGGYRTVYDYAGTELGYGQIAPDTVRVDAACSPVRIDFELGGLALQVHLSDRLDGEAGEVVLHRLGAIDTGQWRTFVDLGGAEIQNGLLDVQMPGILPGQYKIEIVLGRRIYMCNCPYDGEHFWWPGTRDPDESPWYGIAADSLVSLACTLATEPARIEGRISGAWLDMGLHTAPELSIVDPDSVTIMGRRRIEDDGSFAVDVHLPGPVKLLVTQGGIGQWIGGPGFAEAAIYTLQLGQTISDIELVQSGVRFYVEAPDHDAGSTDFFFHDPFDLSVLAVASVDAGFDRHIGIPNLWPGDYLLYVSPGGRDIGSASWRPQWFDRAAGPGQAQLISISGAGDIVPLDLALELGGVIGGRIEQGSGAPRSHYVIVTPANDYTVWGDVYAWYGDQEFSVQGLPDGDFKIGATLTWIDWNQPGPPPDDTVWYPDGADWDAAGVIEIRNASVVTDIVIAVP